MHCRKIELETQSMARETGYKERRKVKEASVNVGIGRHHRTIGCVCLALPASGARPFTEPLLGYGSVPPDMVHHGLPGLAHLSCSGPVGVFEKQTRPKHAFVMLPDIH